MTVKFYSTRDSAVAVLRKAGIDRADYTKHIIVRVDGDTTVYGADISLEAQTANVKATEAAALEVVAKHLKQEAEVLVPNPFNGLDRKETKATAKKVLSKGKGKGTKVVDGKKPVKAKPAAKVAVKKAPKVKAEKAKGSATRNGVSDWIRALIRKGKTNAQILELAEKVGADGKPTHDLAGKKRYFPAWYRFDMKKKGEDFSHVR